MPIHLVCGWHLNTGEPVTSNQPPVTALSRQCDKINGLVPNLVPFDMSSVVHFYIQLHHTQLISY